MFSIHPRFSCRLHR